MGPTHCPHCGQPLPDKRFNVEVSSLKARIIDMIMKGGEEGVPSDEVFATIFQGRNCSRRTLHAHIWQINELLKDEGYKIISIRDQNEHHARDCYRITRIQGRSA